MEQPIMPGKTRTTPIDIESLEFDGDTVLCRVCGDKASGFHYGVHACEGCKGFFRRSIQQKIQYRPCLKNQQCNIMRVNRNRCQYCRLKKCISVGMSRDAVRFGRVPKKEKAKIMEQMQKVNLNSQFNYLNAILQNETNIIQQTIKSHLQTSEYTREKFERFQKKAWQKPVFVECPAHRACPLNPNPGDEGDGSKWEDFSDSFTPAIQSIVDFAKGIPGFTVLNQEDQVTLLKAGTFEVLLLRLSCMFDTQTNTMLFSNGKLYKRPASDNSNAGFLQESMFDFAERLSELHLTDEEVALFSSIVIIASDRPGLRNPEHVERIQAKLTQGLQKMMLQNHPEDPTMFGKLLMKIPDLRTLNTLHSEKLLGMSMLPTGLRQNADKTMLNGTNDKNESESYYEGFPEIDRQKSYTPTNAYIPKVPQYPPIRDYRKLDECVPSPRVNMDLMRNSPSYSPRTPNSSLPLNTDLVQQINNQLSSDDLQSVRVNRFIRDHVAATMSFYQGRESEKVNQPVLINIPEGSPVAPSVEEDKKCFGDHVNGIIEKECLNEGKPKLIPADCLPLRKRSREMDDAPINKVPRLVRADRDYVLQNDLYAPGSPPKINIPQMIYEHENIQRELYEANRRGSLLSNGEESHSTSASSTPSTARSQSPPNLENYLLPMKQPMMDCDPRSEVKDGEFYGKSADKATVDFNRCMAEALEKQRLARVRSDSFGSVSSQDETLAARQAVNNRLSNHYRALAGQLQCPVGSDPNVNSLCRESLNRLEEKPGGVLNGKIANSHLELNNRINQLQPSVKVSPQKPAEGFKGGWNPATSVKYTQSIKDLVHASAVSNLKDKLLQKSELSENRVRRTFGVDSNFQTMRSILSGQMTQVTNSTAPPMLGRLYQTSTNGPPFYPYLYSQYPTMVYPYGVLQQLQRTQLQQKERKDVPTSQSSPVQEQRRMSPLVLNDITSSPRSEMPSSGENNNQNSSSPTAAVDDTQLSLGDEPLNLCKKESPRRESPVSPLVSPETMIPLTCIKQELEFVS